MNLDRQHWRRVGGALVEGEAHEAALQFMKPNLGAVAHVRAPRIETILKSLLLPEIEAAAREIDEFNGHAFVRATDSQLHRLRGSPIGNGTDFRYLVARRLAALLGCSDVAALVKGAHHAGTELGATVDRARALAMGSLAGETESP